MKYTDEFVREAVLLAQRVGNLEAAKQLGTEESNIRRWRSVGSLFARSRNKSTLLSELSGLILTYGPDITVHLYGQKCPHAGEWMKYWRSWPDFRGEAYNILPYAREYNKRTHLEVKDAQFLIGGDAHYWPHWGASTAHRAFVHFGKLLKPSHVVLNGDVFDLPQVTHHRPIAWKKHPDIRDEIEEVRTRLGEIQTSCHGAERYWVWGNHDLRYDNRLAEKIPQYEDVTGMRLQHHFVEWKFQNAIRINDTELEIKHRYRAGEMAVRLNVMRSGISYLTGHDHNRQLYRWRNARGTFYGINPGLMAEASGPQFEYDENHILNHDSGLAVITFEKGKMLPPELIEVMEPGKVFFRGRVTEL